MMFRNIRMEVSYVLLYLVTTVVSLYQTLNMKKFPGELYRETRLISDFETITLTIINLLTFIACLLLYKIFTSYRVTVNSSIRVKFQPERVNLIMSFILFLQITFLLVTGVGRVTFGEPATSPYSSLFAFIKPDPFIFVYFLLVRCNVGFKYQENKHFLFNIVAYSVLKLLQGWSGFIFLFFILECFSRFKLKRNFGLKFVFLIPLFVVFVGGLFYQQIYVIKNQVRGNHSVTEISYIEGVQHLSSRLSMNPTSLGAYQNHSQVVDLYKGESIELKESLALLRPIVPGGLMDKNFRNLNNNIMQSYTPTLRSSSSSDFGFVMYYMILYEASKLDFVLSIILTVVFIMLAKVYFDTISNGKGLLDILFFLLLFKFIYTVSLESVIGQGFIPNLYITVILLLFGGFKLVRRKAIEN